MKLIGKQIVVELPKKIKYWNGQGYDHIYCGGFNNALSEVAKMNPAMEINIDLLRCILFEKLKGIMHDNLVQALCLELAQALASDLSAWMKRKE